jgi:hypothetical protein
MALDKNKSLVKHLPIRPLGFDRCISSDILTTAYEINILSSFWTCHHKELKTVPLLGASWTLIFPEDNWDEKGKHVRTHICRISEPLITRIPRKAS